MRVFLAMALLTVLTCNAQEPPAQPAPQPAPTYASQDGPDARPSQPHPANAPRQGSVEQPQTTARFITVPQGTRIPLVLTTPIDTHATHSGDSLRAETSFPVTVYNQLAIPAGTYAEGQMISVHRPNSSNRPAFQMRFTRLIFANGYAVPLLGATAEARLADAPSTLPVARGNKADSDGEPGGGSSADLSDLNALAFTHDGGDPDEVHTFDLGPAAYVFAGEPQQTPPQPPPLPHVGPSKGLIIGIALGSLAGLFAIFAIAAHHHHNDVYLDAGSKIDLILQNPITLDATSVAGAAAMAGGNPNN
ncbi:MAG: hypothetical protein ABSG16_19040 [Candidatus Acidiferrum sp.]|jgi:hypothetical protein